MNAPDSDQSPPVRPQCCEDNEIFFDVFPICPDGPPTNGSCPAGDVDDVEEKNSRKSLVLKWVEVRQKQLRRRRISTSRRVMQCFAVGVGRV